MPYWNLRRIAIACVMLVITAWLVSKTHILDFLFITAVEAGLVVAIFWWLVVRPIRNLFRGGGNSNSHGRH